MEGVWTANHESEADRNAPLLARISVAAGVYCWLHSRVFACKNNIHISVGCLADKLGAKERSVYRAIKALEREGLIAHEGVRGNGGGSTFRVLRLNECSNSIPLNRTKSPYLNHLNGADSSLLTGRDRHITETKDNHLEGDSRCIYGLYDR